MVDTETLTENITINNEKVSDTKTQGDFPSMGADLLKMVNIKISLFLLLIGFFIFSDVFINNVLPKDYHAMGCPTNQGTMVQLTLFVLSYICIDLLIQGGII
jgi:hypothetical protein